MGFAPMMGGLRCDSDRSRPFTSVHLVSENVAHRPPSSLYICCHPPVLLSVLLSKWHSRLGVFQFVRLARGHALPRKALGELVARLWRRQKLFPTQAGDRPSRAWD